MGRVLQRVSQDRLLNGRGHAVRVRPQGLAAIGKMAQGESGSIKIEVPALAAALNTNPLRARHLLDLMASDDYVEMDLVDDYRLTALGRAYVIQHDLDLDS